MNRTSVALPPAPQRDMRSPGLTATAGALLLGTRGLFPDGGRPELPREACRLLPLSPCPQPMDHSNGTAELTLARCPLNQASESDRSRERGAGSRRHQRSVLAQAAQQALWTDMFRPQPPSSPASIRVPFGVTAPEVQVAYGPARQASHNPARKFQNQLLTTWHKLHRVPSVQPHNA
jgi:hypothetical protein